jgi:hypothetical protein
VRGELKSAFENPTGCSARDLASPALRRADARKPVAPQPRQGWGIQDNSIQGPSEPVGPDNGIAQVNADITGASPGSVCGIAVGQIVESADR